MVLFKSVGLVSFLLECDEFVWVSIFCCCCRSLCIQKIFNSIVYQQSVISQYLRGKQAEWKENSKPKPFHTLVRSHSIFDSPIHTLIHCFSFQYVCCCCFFIFSPIHNDVVSLLCCVENVALRTSGHLFFLSFWKFIRFCHFISHDVFLARLLKWLESIIVVIVY